MCLKVSKYVIYTQHHLRLLCYLHLNGISENQAGDNTLKINRESTQFNLFGEIPRNSKTSVKF